MFVSVTITYSSFALSAAKVPLGQRSRVSLLKSNSLHKPKLTFDGRFEIISFMTRHNDLFGREVIGQLQCELLLSSEIAKAEAITSSRLNGKRLSLLSSDSVLSQIGIYIGGKRLYFRYSIAS